VTASDGPVAETALAESSAVRCRYGRLLTIRSDKFASESVRRYGEWAQQELDLVGRLVAPGDWVVDGGAYIGTHTLAFSRFVGPSGQVVSFEPRLEVFRLLQANVEEVNRLDNVRLLECALGEHPGSLELSPLASDAELANPGGQSVTDRHGAASAYAVAVVTLDALDLERLDFLKLDVEGAEASVIAGARQTIARHHPFVFVELNAIDPGAEVLAAMRAHDGYRAFGSISAAFNSANYNGSTENIFADAMETALLFVPEAKLDRVKALTASFRLTPVDSIDEIALVLLHKPQYPAEILRNTAAGQHLGLDYPSPLAQRLIWEQAEAAEAHANEIEAVRRTADEHLAAATAASEKSLLEQIDSLTRAHAKRVVMLTTGHAEKLRAISRAAAEEIADAARKVEAAHECLAWHERQLAELHASRSWRLTAPLRRVATMLRRALGRRAAPHPPARQ